MKDLELFMLAVNSIRYRSLRSWLAILGVVIGVASIVSLISISTGLSDQISTQLSGLGANIITISSGGGRAMGMGGAGGPPGMEATSTTKPITFKEADALKRVTGVYLVDARLSERATVSYLNKNTSLTVTGTNPAAFLQSANVNIYSGRTLRTSDGRVAVIGFGVMNNTFKDTSMLNKRIKINGQTFQVVGVLNASGSSFGGSDSNIYIPIEAAKTLFEQTQNVSSVIVVANSNSKVDDVANATKVALRDMHRLAAGKEDFQVTTSASISSSISSMTNTLGLFLGVIASISLLVGAIGVANAMFTSVLEQTKYIGILKSLGTRRAEIMRLFIYEAALVGVVGGILGVAVSFVASYAISSYGMPTRISPELIAMGMGFSIAVGVIAGVFPARNAASVPPVEALRYE